MKCPDCFREVPVSASICPFCSANLYQGGSKTKRRKTRQQRIVVGWLVSFSRTPWGEHYAMKQGDNFVGSHDDALIRYGLNSSQYDAVVANLQWRKDGDCWIECLDAAVPVYVDGYAVTPGQPVTLENGCGIAIGEMRFLLYLVTDKHYRLLWPERYEAPAVTSRRRLT